MPTSKSITCRSRLRTLERLTTGIAAICTALACCGIYTVIDLLKIFPFAVWKWQAPSSVLFEIFGAIGGLCFHMSFPNGAWQWQCYPWTGIVTDYLTECQDPAAAAAAAANRSGTLYHVEAIEAMCTAVDQNMLLTILLFTALGLCIGKGLLRTCVVERCFDSPKVHELVDALVSLAGLGCLGVAAVLFSSINITFIFVDLVVLNLPPELQSTVEQEGTSSFGGAFFCALAGAGCLLVSAIVSLLLVNPRCGLKKDERDTGTGTKRARV